MYDGNGSIKCYVDGTGALQPKFDYDAKGRVASATGAKANDLLFRFSTKYFDAETNTVHYRFRDYNPANGKWLSRDPIEEQGGKNLYGFVKNDPVNLFDYFGLDFIAIGDRRVDGTVTTYHYSIQRWCSSKPFFPLNYKKGFTEAEIKRRNPDAVKEDSVELLARQGYQVWASKKRWNTFFRLLSARYWGTVNVWVAEIVFEDRATKIMPTYDNSRNNVDQKWALIDKAARNYPYAEQKDFETKGFKNWPKSMYKSFQTNSNTFVREMARTAGLSMPEMSMFHPGNMTPSQNIETDIKGYKFIFFPAHTPWNSSKPNKPKPTTSP